MTDIGIAAEAVEDTAVRVDGDVALAAVTHMKSPRTNTKPGDQGSDGAQLRDEFGVFDVMRGSAPYTNLLVEPRVEAIFRGNRHGLVHHLPREFEVRDDLREG